MFLRDVREDEESKRNMHTTYTNKAIPNLQLVSQASKFNEGEHAKSDTSRSEIIPSVVPTTWDTVYDPNHPDADWSGLVSLKNNQKKHSTLHRSQILGIEHSEQGIISLEEKKEWLHRRPGYDQNRVSSLILGGVDTSENDRWKTAAMSFQRQESTAREQLTLDKRSKIKKDFHVESKLSKPSFDLNNQSIIPNKNLTGRQSQSQSLANKSLISNISHSIVSNIPEPSYQSVNINDVMDRKTLFADNYRPSPGYTGYKHADKN